MTDLPKFTGLTQKELDSLKISHLCLLISIRVRTEGFENVVPFTFHRVKFGHWSVDKAVVIDFQRRQK